MNLSTIVFSSLQSRVVQGSITSYRKQHTHFEGASVLSVCALLTATK